ncbi:GNAT family N-acetyltransferase [Massilibacteroides sp.]|uniref:GNAT family N-acetyltransferase n=1 Tax=Massilibacteroides sp. TaxID=2034766 RepID=UPI002613E491|nr:GNAT family N-acetyltransferase [Massilibacteroides sp.]MDD4514342.1 GNAT family N-acetyltransferase [Massilibacteroides sp.]
MDYQIIHLKDLQRFEINDGENTAYVEYTLHDGNLDIEHTYVPKLWEGKGLASALVKEAYDYALENKLKPVGTCSYAVTWLQRHPEYVRY